MKLKSLVLRVSRKRSISIISIAINIHVTCTSAPKLFATCPSRVVSFDTTGSIAANIIRRFESIS